MVFIVYQHLHLHFEGGGWGGVGYEYGGKTMGEGGGWFDIEIFLKPTAWLPVFYAS